MNESREKVVSLYADKIPPFKALQRIMEKNPDFNFFTAEGLGRLDLEIDFMILDKEVVDPQLNLDWEDLAILTGCNKGGAFLRRLCVDPSEFIDPSVKEPEPPSEFARQMRSLFKQEDIVRMQIARKSAETIQYIQDALNISGVASYDFSCRGLDISYRREYGRTLRLMPGDEKIMEADTLKVVECFIQLAKMDNPRYSLSRVDHEAEGFGDRGEDLPTTYAQIWESANSAKCAFIYHESHVWKDSTVTRSSVGVPEACRIGHPIERPDEPDFVVLYLTLDWEDFTNGVEGDIVTFRLTHPGRE